MPTAPESRFTLVQKFALLSLPCVLGVTVALCALAATLLARQIVRHEAMDLGEMLQVLMPQLIDAAVFASPAGTDPKLPRTFEGLVPSQAIVRIVAYNRAGIVLWSDDPHLIGKDSGATDGLRNALAGELSVRIVHPGQEHHAHLRPLRSFHRLLEIYVPVRYGKSTPVVGVVELYRDAPRLFALLDRSVGVLWIVGGSAGLLLYGALFVIVRRASATHAALQSELAAHARILEERVAGATAELRATADEIAATRDFLDSIVQSSADAIVTLDARARITFVSHAAVQMLGDPRERLLGTPARTYWRGGVDAFRAFCRALSAHGRVENFQAELRAAGGRSVVVDVSAAMLRGGAPAPRGVVVVIRDVTELRTLQAQVVNTERLATAGLLAAGVAHEIGNPLAGVSSLAQMLRQQSTEPLVQRGLHDIERHVARIDHIVRELTRVARPTRIHLRKIRLDEVLDRAVELARHVPTARTMPITVVDGAGLRDVHGDADRLAQVFLNLILNAADAGGELTVQFAHDHEHVSVSFSDTGRGMGPEEMRRVFDPFFSTKTNGHAGLGLFVSHETVRQHAGRLLVDSRAGAGATFTVVLPSA